MNKSIPLMIAQYDRMAQREPLKDMTAADIMQLREMAIRNGGKSPADTLFYCITDSYKVGYMRGRNAEKREAKKRRAQI